uniref:Uncharacterized protein n=2 Tax=Mycolicibacterium TaxID=1866885 RepID=A0A343VRR4_9MYCO|nr:hypothetical protein B5P44_p00293 [Mycolicibacterium sp. CBMA 213]
MSYPLERIGTMSDLQGTATVGLSELANTDLEGFLDLLSDRAFSEASYRAVGLDYRIIGHTADTVTLQVSAAADPLADQ